MLALLLLPILLSGYIFITFGKFNKLKLHRFTGQLLYLRATAYGCMWFIISTLFMLYVNQFNPEFKSILLNYLMKNLDIKSPTTASLIYLSICSIVLSFVFSILINRIKYCLEDNEIDSNLKVAPRNSLDELLLTSITSSQSLLFNLDSGKIYVGVVMKLSESTEKDEAGTFITIYPIMSGYRDKDNQDAKFLTDYPDYSDSSKHQFAVILFKDELTHVSFFDSEYYLENLKAQQDISGDPNNTEIETTIANKEPNVQDKSHQRNKHKCIISKWFK